MAIRVFALRICCNARFLAFAASSLAKGTKAHFVSYIRVD